MIRQPLKKAVAVLLAALLVASPLPLHAGDLNAEVNNKIGRASCRERV